MKHDFSIDARQWLPGPFTVEEDIRIPQDLNSGTYDMKFALLFPHNEEPAIEMAIEGKDSLGWYPLSQITVSTTLGIGNPFHFNRDEVRLTIASPPYGFTTRISVNSPSYTPITLGIYDCQGKRVHRLHKGQTSAGNHVFIWDETDDRGRALPAGVYFIRGTVAGIKVVESLSVFGIRY